MFVQSNSFEHKSEKNSGPCKILNKNLNKSQTILILCVSHKQINYHSQKMIILINKSHVLNLKNYVNA